MALLVDRAQIVRASETLSAFARNLAARAEGMKYDRISVDGDWPSPDEQMPTDEQRRAILRALGVNVKLIK